MAPRARVLVVDDEEVVRLSIGKILELHGFEVELAHDASTAIGRIASARFDVLLTDLRMSGPEDGLTVVDAMRARNPATATLLMSAHPNIGTSPAFGTFQADEIVAKPIDIPALLRIIKNRLAGEMPTSRMVEIVVSKASQPR